MPIPTSASASTSATRSSTARYKQLAIQQQIAQEQVDAAEMNENDRDGLGHVGPLLVRPRGALGAHPCPHDRTDPPAQDGLHSDHGAAQEAAPRSAILLDLTPGGTH